MIPTDDCPASKLNLRLHMRPRPAGPYQLAALTLLLLLLAAPPAESKQKSNYTSLYSELASSLVGTYAWPHNYMSDMWTSRGLGLGNPGSVGSAYQTQCICTAQATDVGRYCCFPGQAAVVVCILTSIPYVCSVVCCVLCVVLCVVCCLREVRGRAGSLGQRAYTHYTPKPV